MLVQRQAQGTPAKRKNSPLQQECPTVCKSTRPQRHPRPVSQDSTDGKEFNVGHLHYVIPPRMRARLRLVHTCAHAWNTD